MPSITIADRPDRDVPRGPPVRAGEGQRRGGDSHRARVSRSGSHRCRPSRVGVQPHRVRPCPPFLDAHAGPADDNAWVLVVVHLDGRRRWTSNTIAACRHDLDAHRPRGFVYAVSNRIHDVGVGPAFSRNPHRLRSQVCGSHDFSRLLNRQPDGQRATRSGVRPDREQGGSTLHDGGL